MSKRRDIPRRNLGTIAIVVALVASGAWSLFGKRVGEWLRPDARLSAPTTVDIGTAVQSLAVPAEIVIRNPSGRGGILRGIRAENVYALQEFPIPVPAHSSVRLPLSVIARQDPGITFDQRVILLTNDPDRPLIVNVRSKATPAPDGVFFTKVATPQPVIRMAAWKDWIYLAYLDGTIDVFAKEVLSPGLSPVRPVEHITTIAETPNHGFTGTVQPSVSGRVIGGLAVDEQGRLLITHAHPVVDEEGASDIDINSGMLTELSGPPGSYGASGHRRDLVTGLPRNRGNHLPLGVALRAGWAYVAVGAMTDTGSVDTAKPDPDSPWSGAIVRFRLDRVRSTPLVLAGPGTAAAAANTLQDGVSELWATGIRNAFGLTFDAQGRLWLTNQGSDGGPVPRPPDLRGPPISGYVNGDQLRIAAQGSFLGHPNLSRGENVLNDGSEFDPPVAAPADYRPPTWVFGTHTSPTGIVFCGCERVPELRSAIIVGTYNGVDGPALQALRLAAPASSPSGDGTPTITSVQALANGSAMRNVADVVATADGRLVISSVWEPFLRVAG